MRLSRYMSIAFVAFSVASVAVAQSPQTRWDTHEEVLEWIGFAKELPSQGVQQLLEGTRTFVRLNLGQLSSGFLISNPRLKELNLFELTALPTLLDPSSHNAVRVVLRHTMGLNEVAGYWGHRNGNYDESFQKTPGFLPKPAASDGEWHDVTLLLTDSAFFERGDDVVFIVLGIGEFSLSVDEMSERLTSVLETAYLDIDLIEFLNVPVSLTDPTITDFNPKRGLGGATVTIEGSGFANELSRNMVLFNGVLAELVSETQTTLTVIAPSADLAIITILVPGGGKAVASEPFVYLDNPSRIIKVAGDGQTGQVGTTLAPFQVKMASPDGTGLPGLTVEFTILSGQGTLSSTEDVTDDNGVASATVTLGASPGEVRIEAKWSTFRPVVFTVTATP